MKAPEFWSEPPGLLAWLLSPVGSLYGAVTARRMRRPGRALPVPVICVGNLTAGGAGKTPTVLMLAQALTLRGERPFVVSRGYGGRLKGPVRVSPDTMTAADCGDEPLMMARQAPVILARDRVEGAAFAQAAGATVILLDDGLQNPGLAKDFTLCVIDADAGFGNGFCIPAGPLRAPVAKQMPMVDALLIIGEGSSVDLRSLGKPVYRARLEPEPAAVLALRGRRLLAFAGIGRPSKFFATLASAGLGVVRTRSFADHHAYRQGDLAELRSMAAADDLTLVTTQKDRVRLDADADDILAMPVRLETSDGSLVCAIAASIDRRRLEISAGAAAPAPHPD